MLALALDSTGEGLRFATDVTDQKLAQAMRDEHQASLHHTTRLISMTETATTLAHELNQPLAAISNYMKGSRRLLSAGEALPAGLVWLQNHVVLSLPTLGANGFNFSFGGRSDAKVAFKVQVPAGVKVVTPTQTEILISGVDRQQVGQVAAEVRAYRPPEPYKGKGIKYIDEKVHKYIRS